ncbi:SusC/RagA family TonB-linked outer membrane protein [Dawidia soli]|uniref:TonB-dependent receptor n=1 Tax=Dawidia soli TaxID=2782352 RepID=A0AAP2DFW0_9BACT|nr:TonB-dependent receptor [Dawidia soli]MBT1688587.1 TonB-dependent receptor [Dawidia soli]
MRLTVLQVLLIVLVSGVVTARPTKAYGQSVLDEIISVNTQGKKIKQILLEIEKSVAIKFTYNPQTISVDERVSDDYTDEKLSDVLRGIFPKDVQFRLLGDYIILTKQSVKSTGEKTAEVAPTINLVQTITGTVTDEEGMGLPGVSVTIKGTLIGTVTDADGRYSLAGADKGNILVFSFIGYKTEELSVGDQASVDLKMTTDVAALNEVVIVGYGTQKEYTSAGAISSVNVQKQLQYGTTRSMSNNLAGQVAGIIGVQRSGEPGYDDSNFWIRGISTFAGSRTPLVLVDGVERSLNTIDPAEIESVSVLKDASASAVYGVRGANGVVLINTKRGDVGKPSIVLRYEQGVTSPVKLPKFIGAADYMELMNEISQDQGQLPNYSEDRINNTRNKVDPDLYPDVNWLDAITKENASNSRINLTASGGTNFLRYAITGSHYAESGIVARDPNQEWDSSMKLKRYNIRSNVDLDVTPTTLLRVNIGGYLQETNRPPQSMDFLFDQAFQTAPHVHPTQYSSGEIPRVNADRTNPWSVATQTGYERGNTSKIESLFSVQQAMDAIVPGLSGRVLFSFDRYTANSVVRKKDPDYYKPTTGRDENGELMLDIDRFGQVFLNSETKAEFGDKSVYIEGSLNYSHNIGNHYLDGLLLYNQRNYDNGDRLPFRFQGMAARASYSFKRKYIAEANFGYNGSENLSKNNRFGFFPSMALGWVATEEEFMSAIKDVVSRLKIRASLGQVGNDRFIRYAYISTIGETDDYRWGVNNDFHRAGRQEGIKGVSNLTWETVTKANLGVELGFWNSVLLQVDFFKEERKDIFMQRQTIPSSAGFVEKPNANYGKVKNHGVDLSLSADKQLTSDWFISGQGTFTYAKNEIVEQDEAPAVIGTYRSRTGKSVDQNFGYVAERLYTNADFADIENGVLVSTLPRAELGPVRPGDIKYADLNGDGAITNIDQTTLTGTVDPQIVYGFGLNARYKNIDFGFFFQGNARTYRVLGGDFFLPGSGGGAAGNVYETVLTDRWTVDNPNPSAFWPRASFQSAGNNNRPSTWWLRDMSMLRLKHVEIGISLPREFAEKARAKSARIFISGNNLLTFSKFDLWDPEINTGNGFRYPIMKSFSAGINLEF